MNFDNKIIVVDNFYKDPHAVRNFALSLEYESKSVKNYPGFQSCLPVVSASLSSKLESLLSAKINKDVSHKQMGYFRYITKNGCSRLHVHTDMVDWTGVIYLSPDPDPKAGTVFYQHKRTKLYGPPTNEEMLKMGFVNFEDYEDKIIEIDTLDRDAWDVAMQVENKFNRIVLFRSSELFHSHSESFGADLVSSRLTQNFFMNVEK